MVTSAPCPIHPSRAIADPEALRRYPRFLQHPAELGGIADLILS